jgi:hypothetical protein
LDSLEISAGSLRTRYHFYTNKNIAGPLPCPFDKAKKSKSTELQRLTANTNGATTPKPLSPHGNDCCSLRLSPQRYSLLAA